MSDSEFRNCHSVRTENHLNISVDEVDDDAKASADVTADVEFCPLFMDSLPPNFSSNKALAAIASLMADEIVEEKEDSSNSIDKRLNIPTTIPVLSGGGKVSLRQQGKHIYKSEKMKPYGLKQFDEKKPRDSSTVTTTLTTTTVSEAQLFMKLWKL